MKITIIGAGIIGTTSAYYLAKTGHDVEVIERQDGPGLETSFANAGMLTPSMADPWNDPSVLTTLLTSLGSSHSSFKLRLKALPSMVFWGLSFLYNSRKKLYYKNLHRSADMACYSLELMDDIRENLNLNYDQITTGSLKVFRDLESLEKLTKLSQELDQHNMRFQVYYGEELLKIEPSLAPVMGGIVGGVYFPDDQAGNAYKFTSEIEREATQHGAKFHYGVSVEKLIKKGGKITAVKTDQGEFLGDAIVLAAGSYSTPLAKAAGLNVPVRPAKGYSITVPLNGWNGGPKMPIIDDGFHAAISPLGDVLRIAGTAEFAGLDESLTKDRVDNMYDLLLELYPDFALFGARKSHRMGGVKAAYR